METRESGVGSWPGWLGMCAPLMEFLVELIDQRKFIGCGDGWGEMSWEAVSSWIWRGPSVALRMTSLLRRTFEQEGEGGESGEGGEGEAGALVGG